jgi:hypothetical protein
MLTRKCDANSERYDSMHNNFFLTNSQAPTVTWHLMTRLGDVSISELQGISEGDGQAIY